jgi:hypothetical protein
VRDLGKINNYFKKLKKEVKGQNKKTKKKIERKQKAETASYLSLQQGSLILSSKPTTA